MIGFKIFYFIESNFAFIFSSGIVFRLEHVYQVFSLDMLWTILVGKNACLP